LTNFTDKYYRRNDNPQETFKHSDISNRSDWIQVTITNGYQGDPTVVNHFCEIMILNDGFFITVNQYWWIRSNDKIYQSENDGQRNHDSKNIEIKRPLQLKVMSIFHITFFLRKCANLEQKENNEQYQYCLGHAIPPEN